MAVDAVMSVVGRVGDRVRDRDGSRGRREKCRGRCDGRGPAGDQVCQLQIFNELVQDAVATSRGRVDVDKVRRRLDGGEAMTDGGHVGDAREVDERRGEPHRRGRESDTRTL